MSVSSGDNELHRHLIEMKNGSLESFDFVYNKTHKDVYRLISMLINNQPDREDIMNEVYMQMWRSLDNYETEKSFKAWLHGITIHQINSYRRKNWRIFRIFEKKCSVQKSEDIYYEPDTLHFELKNEVMRLIGELSDKLREVIIFRYYYEYSFKEISDILKIPIGTVKSRHHSALNQLKKYADFQIEMSGGKVNVF